MFHDIECTTAHIVHNHRRLRLRGCAHNKISRPPTHITSGASVVESTHVRNLGINALPTDCFAFSHIGTTTIPQQRCPSGDQSQPGRNKSADGRKGRKQHSTTDVREEEDPLWPSCSLPILEPHTYPPHIPPTSHHGHFLNPRDGEISEYNFPDAPTLDNDPANLAYHIAAVAGEYPAPQAMEAAEVSSLHRNVAALSYNFTDFGGSSDPEEGSTLHERERPSSPPENKTL